MYLLDSLCPMNESKLSNNVCPSFPSNLPNFEKQNKKTNEQNYGICLKKYSQCTNSS